MRTDLRTRMVAAACVVALPWLSAGCTARRHAMVDLVAEAPRSCRPLMAIDAAHVRAAAWKTPADLEEREKLDAWCDATGPPVIEPLPRSDAGGSNELVIVSWNLHVGGADLAELVHRLRAGALTGGVPVAHFVLLLQEAHRGGDAVPRVIARRARAARAIRSVIPGRARVDIVDLARSHGLAVYYVPSMRNGGSGVTDEDRGNAILSTQPLSEFTAIELPFERQRRVAISAVATGRDHEGETWRLRVASVHFDSLASARHLWIAGPGARARQARGLLEALDRHQPLVIGGDLNTWLGFSDPAYRTIARVVPDAAARDPRPTFRGLFRLDHLFARLPAHWKARAERVGDRLGSDHHPLIARLRVAS